MIIYYIEEKFKLGNIDFIGINVMIGILWLLKLLL